jgi:NTP pyrophosphatase (non-canonical NTP hydrolase)
MTQNTRRDMSDLEELRKAIVEFTQERDWDQFHNGKDLALALSIEASELNEAFLWKDANDVNVEKVKEELADIVNYAILIANRYNLDIKQIVLDKLKRNAEKYPVDKAYGSAKKYNEL